MILERAGGCKSADMWSIDFLFSAGTKIVHWQVFWLIPVFWALPVLRAV